MLNKVHSNDVPVETTVYVSVINEEDFDLYDNETVDVGKELKKILR